MGPSTNRDENQAADQLKHVRYLRQDDKAGRRALTSAGYAFRGISKKGSQIFVLGHDPVAAEQEAIDAIETTFGLERDLQLALRANIEQLEKGLRVIDGGKEQTVESGRIDITAEDRSGSVVVIELKAGPADREAIAQILSYMGDLGQDNKSVRGILVAGDFPPRSIAAARAVPNLQLRKYTFKFSFASVGAT